MKTKKHSKETIRQQRHRERKNVSRSQKQAERRRQRQEQGRCVAYQMYRTITHFFPDLFKWMSELEDCRTKSTYALAELITACLAIFLFKAGSRNELNNMRDDPKFCKNFEKLFKLSLPHPDTVDRVMRILPDEQLETLKRRMIQALLNQKVLHKYRFQKKWFIVAVDASGVVSFEEQHCDHCLHRTHKKSGKTTWHHNVLEAKLITQNGFAISLGTEWIENPASDYNKQDCERKAFSRLAEKLKRDYPRLPICLTADGLYPYQGFFDICQKNAWSYILTFKDGNLPSLWEEIEALTPLQIQNQRDEVIIQGKSTIKRQYRWITNIDYHGHTLHWIECLETVDVLGKKDSSLCRFAHLTDIALTHQIAPEISATGRLRWKIENEGFNAQKNQGYEMEHKYSRKSYQAMKNYYQSLQIAHIINELLVLSQTFQELMTEKMTIKHLWKRLCSLMTDGDLEQDTLDAISVARCQIRFAT